jgi:hypothetical protein
MCSMLYQFSGKCNKNLQAASTTAATGGDYTTMYQSLTQYKNEDSVCSYIDSIRYNTYDHNGEIVLDQTASWNPISWKKEMSAQSRVMSKGLKAGLIITSLAAFGMAVCALVLHGMLSRKNVPWRAIRKPGEDPFVDPTDLARQSSGIVMGRSRSGPATTPLI